MTDRKNFIRLKENFTCEHCQVDVVGTGYTNHCPNCLWSKHVDNLPGDRSNPCCGLMEPIHVVLTGDGYDLIHQCLRCGITKRNKVVDNDNRDTIVDIIKKNQ